jgi:hypothetical protein
MNSREGVKLYIHDLLTTAVDGGERSALKPAVLSLGKRLPFRFDRRLCGFQRRFENVDLNSDPSVLQPVVFTSTELTRQQKGNITNADLQKLKVLL